MAAPGEPPSEGLRLLGHVDRDDRRHERRDERDDDRQNVFRSSELFFRPEDADSGKGDEQDEEGN